MNQAYYSKSKMVVFPPGKICYRCGISRADHRKMHDRCIVMGFDYFRHIWNDRPVRVRTYFLKTGPPKRERPKKCPVCKKVANRKNAIYCSVECKRKDYKKVFKPEKK